VYDYVGSKELEYTYVQSAPGTSLSFVGCLTVNGVPATPGSLGCDTSSEVTVPLPFVFHPIPVHFN
jgi:hypothetical protein